MAADRDVVKIQLEPVYINFFNRIMEGYEYLGTVTTIDKVAGIVMVRTTADFYSEVREIIENLPFSFAYID